MSYWKGLSETKQKEYLEKFKEPTIERGYNPFKARECKHCDQLVVMKLINDRLSNSSFLVYVGMCTNRHWNQDMPTIPYDTREIPKCKECGSFMQYKMSVEYNGWVCVQNHNGEVRI